MAVKDYAAAQKQGRKGYQSALTRGQYPYLPVLDDILSYTEVAQTVSLGLMDIPLARVVGTKTAGRTNAFANNFMPLLPEKSEFGAKWASLYDHQINEGIRDPIVVYEFMNRFYVQEGNKRVSVMKFLGAYSIAANVTRLVPRRTDEKENRLYYEFLEFYQVSRNYDIWFTREGSYRKLLKLMGKKTGEVWTDEERKAFSSVYDRFSSALKTAHGEKPVISVSDVFLVYVEIYGYEQAAKETEHEMHRALQKMWEEVRLAEKGSQIALVQNPESEKSSLLNRLLPAGTALPETFKAAFVYSKTPQTSGWTYAHELGRLHLEQAFAGKVETMAFENANTEAEVENAIELAVAAGCNLIFTIAIQMVNPSVRAAIRHPKVRIFNCSVQIGRASCRERVWTWV